MPIEADAEFRDRSTGLRHGGTRMWFQVMKLAWKVGGVDSGIEELHLLDEVIARIDGRALEVVHVIAVDDSPGGRDQLALMVPMASSACCLQQHSLDLLGAA